MKKYLLGLFAVALAVGFTAFTLPKTAAVDDVYTFEFLPTANINYVDADYENIDNWSNPSGTANPSCGDPGSIVCKITVLQQDVDAFSGSTARERFIAYLQSLGSSETQVESVLPKVTKE